MLRILIYTLAILCVFAAAILGYAIWDTTRGPIPGETTRVTGEALVGGPFELVNGNGETVTDADFRGEYMLIYFGFTYCPDVCPLDLATMSDALDMLDENRAGNVQPLFISVDPERDTPEVVGQYVQHFHPRLMGLTGTPEQVAEAADAYRVYYRKAEVDGATDYLVDHSSIVYLMGPDGGFLTHFRHGATAEEMAEGIRRHIEAG